MENGIHNRITKFLDDDTPTARSASQRQASKLNGAKSHGPRTKSGKDASSQNAVRHGLLAQRFSPPVDGRGDDQLFKRIRRQLLAEYKPASFTATCVLDALASDMIQMSRCRQMIEFLEQPPALAEEDQEKYKELREAQHDLTITRRLLARLEAGQRGDLKQSAAARVGVLVAEAVEGLKLYFAEPEGTPESEMDDVERQEYRTYLSRWDAVKAGAKRLLDRGRTAAFAQGLLKPTTAESKRLQTILLHVTEGLSKFIASQEKLERRVNRHQLAAVAAAAQSPERLLLVQRYLTRIERAIERKVRFLRAG